MGDAAEKLAAHILQIGTEAERIRSSSAECLWICRHEKPPLLPDADAPTGEQNSTRRQDGKPVARQRSS
jgi:hypothetical protein